MDKNSSKTHKKCFTYFIYYSMLYSEILRIPPDTQHYDNVQKMLDLYNILIYYSVRYSGIVQSVEQRTVNPYVTGSSPVARATFYTVLLKGGFSLDFQAFSQFDNTCCKTCYFSGVIELHNKKG